MNAAGARRRWQLSAYSILFWIIVLMAVLTWVIPAGSYLRQDGIPVAGSYHAVPRRGQGLGAVLLSAVHGFYDAVEVALFLLMVGGFLGVVMHTGAIDAGIGRVVRRLAGREQRMIPVLMLLFALGGTTFGMWEETMAFYPLLIPMFTAAGYDALTAVAVVVLGAGTGTLCSTVNPFATGIASGFAGVSMGQGLGLRLLMLAVLLPVAIWWVLRHARRIRRPPTAAPADAAPSSPSPLTPAQRRTLWGFGLTFGVMIYAVIPFDELGLPLPTLGWGFPQLAGLFLVAGVAIGFAARLGEQTVYDAFLRGAGELLGVALIIALSRGITVVMNAGQITDTLLHWGEQGLAGAHAAVFVLLVFGLYLGLSVLIPSSSGLATLSVPVLAPLGQFAGVSAALVVTAFQAASGLVNLLTPTSAVIMGALALGELSWPRWLRFVGGFWLLALVLSTGLLLLGVAG